MEALLVETSGGEPVPEARMTLYGKVLCEGVGVPDVVVSDGCEVVRTDADGVYQMASQKRHGYVFISVPSGYEVPSSATSTLEIRVTDRFGRVYTETMTRPKAFSTNIY
ncbi:MAG: hypothetical protein II479_06095 [Bacteroidales bacterium]|nr:hypothetical protein [Bacteroidales bacterium]